MLFFVNEQGTTVNMVNEPVNVGSTNANEVILVAPISQANQVTIAFRLPNGATVSERTMSLLEQQLVINNKTYSVYRYLMDGTITAVSGICKVQFKIYQYQFTNDDSVRNAVLATYTSNFVIREGIFATFPETPTSTIYQQILTYLATLNPNYLVQSVDYVNEDSLIEPETWASGVLNKIVCYDPTSLNAYGVTSACELSLANLFGGQNKPLFICNTEMADVYADLSADNIGTGVNIQNISTPLHTGKVQINISNCKYDTIIKVAHYESDWIVDGTFVVRAANGSNVNIICGIQKTNVTAFAVFQDYNATRELDESKGDDYLPPKTAHDNDPSITEFQGFTKERYQINSVYTWAYTQDGDVWDMVGGTLQLKMLNGNIWSFPDFDYNATKLACKEYKDLSHKWANYSDDSDTPSATNNSYYYCELAHAWANNGQAGTPSAINNAMYFAGQAATSAVNASNSETAANNSKLAAQTAEANAHAWATGDSTDGTSPSSTNNAKYFADNAHDDADNAHNEALDAASYADLAHGWANNEDADEGATPTSTNNAKYYSDEAASVLATLNSQKGQANGIAPLNANGKIDSSYLDPLDIHDYVKIDDVADLQDPNLNVQVGDIAYMVDGGGDIISSWLLTATSPSRVWVQINSSYASSAAHADSATNAGNVTTTINGKNISAIFESDGTTVKNATNAVNATNSTNATNADKIKISNSYVTGDSVQSDIDSKIPKANIDTSIPATPSDANVPSTKLLNDTTNGLKTDLEDGDVVVAESLHSQESDVASNLVNDSGKMLDPDVESSSGTIYKDEAFVRRATAIPFSGETVTVANGVEEILKDQALSVNKNQKVQNGNFASTSNWSTTNCSFSVANNTATILATAQYGNISQNISTIVGHKYLVIGTLSSNLRIRLKASGGSEMIAYNELPKVITASYAFTEFKIDDVRASDWTNETAKNVMCVDLTQFFLSQPSMASCTAKWFLQNYPEYTSYVAYNTGTLEDTPSYKYVTTNENLWDEEWEVGGIDATTGAKITEGTKIRSKNYISVWGGQYVSQFVDTSNTNAKSLVFTFYDADYNIVPYVKVNEDDAVVYNNAADTTSSKPKFVVPMGACWCLFRTANAYGTTYNYGIQICNHFTEQDVENTYHPHQEWERNVDWSWTSTGKGKSALEARDTKDYVNRKNIEKVGKYTFTGEELWTQRGVGDFYTEITTANLPVIGTLNQINNIGLMPQSSTYDTSTYGIALSYDNGKMLVFIRDTSVTNQTTARTLTNGKTINYALKTYIESNMSESEVNTTTESDYGNEVKVPLLNSNFMTGSFTTIFYQDNVLRQIYNNKDAIEKMPSVNGLADGDYICKVSSGVASYVTPESEGYYKMQDLLTVFGLKDAVGGTLCQLLANKTNVDFVKFDFVDMGAYTWTQVTNTHIFYTGYIPKLSGNADVMCTKYQYETTADWVNISDNRLTINTINQNVYIRNDNINSASELKASLNGVLFAFRKFN